MGNGDWEAERVLCWPSAWLVVALSLRLTDTAGVRDSAPSQQTHVALLALLTCCLAAAALVCLLDICATHTTAAQGA